MGGWTTKKLIIITICWTVLMIGVGSVGIWWIIEHPIRGVSAEDRASRIGTGVGTLTSIGYAVLWLPYAYRIGKQKREAKQRGK